MFEGAEVEGSKGTVFADGDEDVGAAGEPGDVVLIRNEDEGEGRLGRGREGVRV